MPNSPPALPQAFFAEASSLAWNLTIRSGKTEEKKRGGGTYYLFGPSAASRSMAATNSSSDDDDDDDDDKAKLGVIGDFHTRSKEVSGEQEQLRRWRFYEGCDVELLPLRKLPTRNPPLERRSLSTMLLASLAFTGLRRSGSNVTFSTPSAGNIYSTEAFLLLPVDDERSTLSRYLPRNHGLERRALFSKEDTRKLFRKILRVDDNRLCATGAMAQEEDDDEFFATILTANCEDRKELRSFRYCQQDLGHAAMAVAEAAQSLGWHCRVARHLADESIANIIGTSSENGGVAMVIRVPRRSVEDTSSMHFCSCERDKVAEETVLSARGLAGARFGRPLKDEEMEKNPLLDAIQAATRKPETRRCPRRHQSTTTPKKRKDFVAVARRSRAATRFDPYDEAHLAASDFYAILQGLVDDDDGFLDSFAPPPRPVSFMLLFVHRVFDVAPGLYAFVRSLPQNIDAVTQALRDRVAKGNATWGPPPDSCPLFLRSRISTLLAPADLRHFAREFTCDQALAADGFLTFVIFADFGPVFFGPAPWRYKELHREAGALDNFCT